MVEKPILAQTVDDMLIATGSGGGSELPENCPTEEELTSGGNIVRLIAGNVITTLGSKLFRVGISEQSNSRSKPKRTEA